jgi:ribosomal protein L21E
MADKPAQPFKVGDRVKINSAGTLIRWGSLQPLNRAGGRTGKIVRVINRHLYYVEWDEPFVAAYNANALEKIEP